MINRREFIDRSALIATLTAVGLGLHEDLEYDGVIQNESIKITLTWVPSQVAFLFVARWPEMDLYCAEIFDRALEDLRFKNGRNQIIKHIRFTFRRADASFPKYDITDDEWHIRIVDAAQEYLITEKLTA